MAMEPSRIMRFDNVPDGVADLLMYTDAEKDGHVGAVLVAPKQNDAVFFRSRVPAAIRRRLLRRKTQINLYELLAVLCAIHTFSAALQGKRVAAFIDNKAALNICIKAWSRKTDANAAAFHIWSDIARHSVDVYWAYVPSKLNIADGPSRNRCEEVWAAGAVEREAVWPEEFSAQWRVYQWVQGGW